MSEYPMRRIAFRTRGETNTWLYALAGFALILFSSCHKQVTQTPPPAAAAPTPTEKPTVNYFDVEPAVVTKGQHSSLRWSIDNATSVEIAPDIGPVKANDQRVISPAQTTKYTLKANNVAGAAQASVTVTVNKPATTPPESGEGKSDVIVVNHRLIDVHFDYNKGDLNDQERSTLEDDARILKNFFESNSGARVTIEGHCDDRGSDEYNFALGDRRASTVKDALVKLGLTAEKLETVSYGKERPLCFSPTEECYARNRRAHFVASLGAAVHSTTVQP